jgi:hypothetical protein
MTRRDRGRGAMRSAPADEFRHPERSEDLGANSNARTGRGVVCPDNALPSPEEGERIEYDCTGCGHEADATYKYVGGKLSWQVGNAFTPRCPKGKECLELIAEAVGTEPWRLKEDPRQFLPDLASGSRSADKISEKPRDEDAWRSCVRVLRREARALNGRRYCRRRGIDYLAHDLGHTVYKGYEALVARQYCGGEVVSEAFRYYGAKPFIKGKPRKNDNLTGCPVGWIGEPPGEGGLLVLCAGFVDGFVARQHDLNAVSTPGVSLPPELLPDLVGYEVAVVYDVTEIEQLAAARSVERLRDAGTDAWKVTLPLPEGGDVADWFVKYGHSADALKSLIRSERRAA